MGALLTDTSFSKKLHQSVVSIKLVTDSLALVSGDLRAITAQAKSGKGTIGALLMDTTLVSNLNQSMENAKNGTKGFDENMEALKHNVLLRNYFKKKEKEEKRSKK
jgi:phospholipid/cholesterol/gamma-HCH transport system substrate-binding protein